MCSITPKGLRAMALCWLAANILMGCNQQHPTNPMGSLDGSWPTEATGRFALLVEGNACGGPFGNCGFVVFWTDTLDVCGDPVMQRFQGFPFVQSVAMEGVVSQSLYKVRVTVTFNSGCENVISYSSETGSPPSRDGWQFLCKMQSTTCGLEPELDPVLYRYTYSRVGDTDCTLGRP